MLTAMPLTLHPHHPPKSENFTVHNELVSHPKIRIWLKVPSLGPICCGRRHVLNRWNCRSIVSRKLNYYSLYRFHPHISHYPKHNNLISFAYRQKTDILHNITHYHQFALLILCFVTIFIFDIPQSRIRGITPNTTRAAAAEAGLCRCRGGGWGESNTKQR